MHRQPKQEIACTRSFGHPVTELARLAEAVTEFASRAAQKVRKQHSLAGQVMVSSAPVRFARCTVQPVHDRATAQAQQ